MAGKNIFVTGKPGCGKSTFIEKVIHRIQEPTTGFFTREIREKGRRVGFSLTTLNGQSGTLAHEKIKSRFRVGKYGVNLADIDHIAVPSIIPDDNRKIVVIDEIGKMECFSALFRATLIKLLDAENKVIGSIALKGDPFVQKLKTRDDVMVIELRPENRESSALLNLFIGGIQ